jgi:hypothetical protein
VAASLALGCRVRIADGVLARDLEDEVVLLDLKSGVYCSLEGVGARIWNLLEPGRTLRQVLAWLVAEYDVEPSRCARDLLTFVTELRARGLVEVDDPHR